MKNVLDPEFAPYGRVLEGYDTGELLSLLRRTECPGDRVIYIPSDPVLEALPIMRRLSDCAYGGMPIQIGYCNGSNRRLNCLEYHRGCELNIPADEIVLLLAPLQKLRQNTLNTQEVQAFRVRPGTVVLLYETTMHYAPCNVPGGNGFRTAVVLPRDTNLEKPSINPFDGEGRLLWARNKWLIAHPDADEAKEGACVGLKGENITVR